MSVANGNPDVRPMGKFMSKAYCYHELKKKAQRTLHESPLFFLDSKVVSREHGITIIDRDLA